jgi:methylmalonyl-CoA mutase
MKATSLPVMGITGTGGSGKSSLTDELMLRLLQDFERVKVASSAWTPPAARPAARFWATASA